MRISFSAPVDSTANNVVFFLYLSLPLACSGFKLLNRLVYALLCGLRTPAPDDFEMNFWKYFFDIGSNMSPK